MSHEWIESYVQRIQVAMGLQAWEINIRPARSVSAKLSSDASCDADHPYLTADITVMADVWYERMAEPSVAGKILLCHEMLHVLFSGMAHAMEQTVNIYFPPYDEAPSDKSTAMRLFQDAEEHTIARFANAIYEALERDEELEGYRSRRRSRDKS